ncbi:hypothetical protein E4K64_37385 [Bradyrhizobium frederickii]|uniref:Uncharacterized protein n=1 Tax=Bradyrhizobium frederickii TaxID=2560054 RepID=A0A4Y9KSQ9_9BRAD|nr:hypothetical protein E4K66_39015 [Bradyrhizobium frederickii]TFV68108.1 hypothetical protein E4K64_37385 [Bradyrhizobium frederickii]
MGSPENAASPIHPACSGKQRRPPCRSRHGRKPRCLPKDEAGTEPHGIRSRGRSQSLLYNEERPHGAIGNRPPILLHNHVGATSPPT